MRVTIDKKYIEKMKALTTQESPDFSHGECQHAIGNVIKEEKELDERVRNLISVLKFIIDCAGFELISRIEVRDKKTRKEFR